MKQRQRTRETSVSLDGLVDHSRDAWAEGYERGRGKSKSSSYNGFGNQNDVVNIYGGSAYNGFGGYADSEEESTDYGSTFANTYMKIVCSPWYWLLFIAAVIYTLMTCECHR
jgi:hypothetical protein